MIKQALEYLIGLGKANIIYSDYDETYSDKPLHKINMPIAGAIHPQSLSAVVDYIKAGLDEDFISEETLLVHIEDPITVNVYGELNNNARRSYFIGARANVPDFRFGCWYNTETFNIGLQSCFIDTEDRDVMLQVVGNIKEENVQTIGDDGVSQAVTAKAGVATVATVKVPNPVVLKPYRTFIEVDQPESSFVFRMKSGPECALFEADGGAWEREAMSNIKAYLEEHLAAEIEAEKVVIIA